MANPIVFAVVVGIGLSLALWYFLSDAGGPYHETEHHVSSASKSSFNGKYRSSTCTICQDNLSSGSRLLKCGHGFHQSCIEKWFEINKPASCPNCRKSV